MERDAQQMKRTRLAKISFTMLCLIMIAAYFYPLPYYVSKPGMAKELESVVEVEGGSSAEGSFMLTTHIHKGIGAISVRFIKKVI